MAELEGLRVVVVGRVQGVFFRAFVQGEAHSLGLTGYVRNLPEPSKVEVYAEGERQKLEALLGHLKVGPPGAKVERLEVAWALYRGSFREFTIR